MHQDQHQHQQQQQSVISPQATTSMEMATGIRPPEPRGLTGQIEVKDARKLFSSSRADHVHVHVHVHVSFGVAGDKYHVLEFFWYNVDDGSPPRTCRDQ